MILLTVYVPHRENAKAAALEISDVIHDIEVAAPDALILINGVFNHCTLGRSSSQYYQHVKCKTRGDVTLDYCYSNVKDAYTSTQLPKLGRSDHDLILLRPKYRPVVQRRKPEVINARKWSPEAFEQLQGSIACTDWNVFIESSSDIHDVIEVSSDYINFCLEFCVPVKTVKIYPNNKPWVTRSKS